jgi:hypothetical protein
MLRHFCLSTHTAGGCVPLDSLYLYIKGMAFLIPPPGGNVHKYCKGNLISGGYSFISGAGFYGGISAPPARA